MKKPKSRPEEHWDLSAVRYKVIQISARIHHYTRWKESLKGG